MSSRGTSPGLAPGQEPDEEDFAAVNASAPPAGSDDEDVDVNAVAADDEDGGAGGEDDARPAGYNSDEEDQAEDAALGNEALREVAKRERERLRAVKRARAEELKKLKATEDKDFAADQATRLKKRMQFLLKQADIFQHFMPTNVSSSSSSAKADASAGAASKAKKKSRHATGRASEDAEDAALLADEAAEADVGHRLTVQPGVVKGTMRKYQLEGLNWLIHLYDNSMNGILADEMGLGKTLQTISLLGYLHEYRGITGPHLVIVPKSTLHNWINEFRKWCPAIRAVKFHGNKEQRAEQKQTIMVKGAFDACVTSFEMVIKEKSTFLGFKWKYVIIDEAHRIKNEKSVLFQAVKRLDTCYRLLITGTPLQNNLHELWALLHFLLPEMFSSADAFEEWFSPGGGDGAGGGAGGDGAASGEQETEVVSQLHKVLRPFLLRRLKSDVEKGLPPKKETILKIGMSDLQKRTYGALLQRDIEAVNGAADRSRLLNVVMQLRKCCNHPYLFQGTEPGPPYTTGDHLIEASGKMVLLDKLLPKLQSRQSRVLIFSQMTRLLDILEDYCLYRGYNYCRIDGNTSGEDRESQIDEFNAENSEKFIFLLSTRAGGLGINLYTADVVVLYDSDWNPQMDLQAMDRAHRIGQKKEVQVFRFCVEHSIEEKVIEKAYKKLRLDALVIQQGRLTENTKTVNKEDLLSMVRYGAEMVFSSEAASLTDEDIDAIIKKGERATEDLNQKMQQFADGAMKFTLDGGVNLYDFKGEGEDGEGGAGGAGGGGEGGEALRALIGHNWIDPPKRERKRVVTYAENEYYRQAMKLGGGGGGGPRASAAVKPPKGPNLHDFQFYDTKRINALYDKETAYEAHKHSLAEKERSARAQGASEEVVQAQIAPGPDDPQPLSQAELDEREQLLSAGFSNWSKKDFNSFLRACEKHGRDDVAGIASEIEGKSEDDVEAYLAVFKQRFSELNDHERLIRNIERGEARLKRHEEVAQLIRSKLAQYKNPWCDLRLSYGSNKGKAYTEENDRFILCSVERLGYGRWDELKAAIRASFRFRFDWYFKSRTPQELSRRCDTLIRLVEKEKEEEDAAAAADAAAGGGGGVGGGGSAGARGKTPPSAGKKGGSRASSAALDDDGGGGGEDCAKNKRARSTSAEPMAVDGAETVAAS